VSTTTTIRSRLGNGPPSRAIALAGIAALTAGYCSTLYWVTTVGGGTGWLFLAVTGAVAVAVAARGLPERAVVAASVAVALLAGAWYATTALPTADGGTIIALLAEPLVLASGNSVRAITAVDVWIAAVAPVPTFVSVYLALRRRYVLATVAGGWLLVLLALTGDATTTETLVGTLGAATAVGFGELDARDAPVTSGDLVVALLAIMAVLAIAVPLVPPGAASPIDTGTTVLGGPGDDGPGAGQGSGGTGGSGDLAAPVPLDDQVLSGDAVAPGGPIELSTDVRFVVEAEERQRWRVDAMDQYTGQRWIQRGSSRPYEGSLPSPPGSSRTLDQRFDLRTTAEGLPAAAYPVDVRDVPRRDLIVTRTGSPAPRVPLSPEDDYEVRSEVPTPTTEELWSAGTDYPDAIQRRYTGLPADLPDRVVERTDRVTSNATNPYETAVGIEAYLEDSHGYSQNVSAPDGDVVDTFLFEMDAGYCTYFAASMATMLRTQDVPARVAVGYSGGQWAGNDTWVVRGTDAHAWVEVYFPDVGWVEFDPTPASDRRQTSRAAIERAREDGTADVDVPESEGRDVRFEASASADGSDGEGGTGEEPETDGATGDTDGTTSNDTVDGPPGRDTLVPERYRSENLGNDSQLYVDPGSVAANGSADARAAAVATGHRLLEGVAGPILGLVLLSGSVAGARRSGAVDRVRRSTSFLWQRRRSPARDADRAIDRLDRLLGRRYRPRRPGETRREYVAALPDLDPRVHRAYELHERVRYAAVIDDAAGGETTDGEAADELVALVDGLCREALPVVGRLRD